MYPFKLPRVVTRLLKIWDSYQVELQGHYSVERVQEFTHYANTASRLRVTVVQVMTLIPPIIAIVLPDLLPLNPPVGGLKGQSTSYWIRTFYAAAVVTATCIAQFYHALPHLPLKLSWFITATVIVATLATLLELALHMIIGFPTPFLYQLVAGPWQTCLFTSMWMMWRKTLQQNQESREDLKRFMWLWLAQTTMIIVYPVLGHIFRVISPEQRLILAMVLPLWKMGLKLWASYGAYRIEDQTPVFVVFTVDVFHALFLSSAMQSSANLGYGTLFVVILVDVFQSGVAIAEIHAVLLRIQEQAQAIDVVEAKATASSNDAPECHYVATESKSRTRCSSLSRAFAILENHHHIRDHPEVCFPRHKRVLPIQLSTITPSITENSVETRPAKRQSLAKVHTFNGTIDQTTRRRATFSTDTLNDLDYARLAFVRETMKLLYMMEFYMLIEFTEVFIALVYYVYLVVISQLPNRIYYAQLETITDDQWGPTVAYVLLYSGYEFFSYVTLAILFRVMTRISGIKMIAFSLEKHWRLVQALSVLWVFFVIQMSLKHLGCDYTFKFVWLKHIEGR